MRFKKNITGFISWMAGVVVGVMVLIIPLGYFFLSYQHAKGNLEAEAEINSRIISRIISDNPDLWRFEHERILEYLARRPRKGHAEIRRVTTKDGALVAESADDLVRPTMSQSVELFDAGTAVGRLEIIRSLRPLLVQTGLLALFMLPLGAGVFMVLRILPIRVIRRSEESLRKERDAAQKYLDVAGVMLVVIDAEQRVAMINRKGCEILGCPEEEILHKNWFDHFVPERSRSIVREDFLQLGRGSEELAANLESPILNRNSEERVIAWNHIVLTDDSGGFSGTLNSGEDITERRNLENQLRHAQKMEAIGVLAGGIAHDFNNILSAIIGYASLLHMDLRNDDPLLGHVDQILKSSDRAARLVKSLLAFSRKQIIDPKPVKVKDLVKGVERLLARLLREDIELRTSVSDETMMINADAGQMEQILMNLATNARDAMPEGGLFSIEAGVRELDDGFIKTHGYGTVGTYARISVSDTGIGMTRQTQESIFEPFFTTKEVGKGTGLGLSMTYGIIKQHKGYINVSSEPGKGTTFELYLPLLKEASRQTGPKADRVAARNGGAETVLIAEDDAAVRASVKMVLENSGYTVLEAGDGEEAVHVFAQYKNAIGLVILDVIMPKKNGKTAFDEIKKLRPEVKALFTSGYTAEIINDRMRQGDFRPILSKPASPETLLKKVREALDA